MRMSPTGEIVSEHRATWPARILALLLLGAPAVALTYASLNGPESVVKISVTAPLLLLCGLIFVQQGKSRVVLRQDGLERYGLRGMLWALRWEDAPVLRYKAVNLRLGGVVGLLLPASRAVYLKLVDTAGGAHRVPRNLAHHDSLVDRIVEEHRRAYLPALAERLERGERVDFGKDLRLDRDQFDVRGFFGRRKICPLADVERVSVDAGFLRIRRRGKMLAFASIPVARIPNVFLLLHVLETMLGPARAGAARGRDFAANQHVA